MSTVQESRFWGLVVCQQQFEEFKKNTRHPSDTMFQEKILGVLEKHAISFKDLEEVWEWDAEYLNLEADSAVPGVDVFCVSESQLSAILAILDIILSKRKYEQKYPGRKIDFNRKIKMSTTNYKITRNWLTIDGENLKYFEKTPSPA